LRPVRGQPEYAAIGGDSVNDSFSHGLIAASDFHDLAYDWQPVVLEVALDFRGLFSGCEEDKG
jgi:hypothetical protein